MTSEDDDTVVGSAMRRVAAVKMQSSEGEGSKGRLDENGQTEAEQRRRRRQIAGRRIVGAAG